MTDTNDLKTELIADIVSAYVSNNPVPVSALPDLIASVAASLGGLVEGEAPALAEPQMPAVPIKKSVRPDYIVSLEDGRKFKSLKRHLRTSYGMTPDEYRAKWNLPSDYPMVAPNYSKTRSDLAKSLGLGHKPTQKPNGRRRKKSA
ncbi:MucR family transcriptional regulator [Allomesorhizobium alhagi]|uniref:Transcriptional regulatory protein, nodulation competitiveness determinant n=1 Tax=Mesorhizobium alhagi CCNWXJ12-2 TaxID=1107882 RepID=H0HZ81_9HYPH|nr:MucR family transcriptional regulator [Mesorhizobium alhagi]EHK53964.1 transcriptional regulatory protein, nodulation competitiveness determinant [Mesorhizobium alhagi CCNWXJ12-2]